mmetsp:Transcript_353/g.852  ORF Transcript_353/g.852 Transcript_353/m.852 type:complete len:246 (+) Transcript_353:678-1415(+)
MLVVPIIPPAALTGAAEQEGLENPWARLAEDLGSDIGDIAMGSAAAMARKDSLVMQRQKLASQLYAPVRSAQSNSGAAKIPRGARVGSIGVVQIFNRLELDVPKAERAAVHPPYSSKQADPSIHDREGFPFTKEDERWVLMLLELSFCAIRNAKRYKMKVSGSRKEIAKALINKRRAAAAAIAQRREAAEEQARMEEEEEEARAAQEAAEEAEAAAREAEEAERAALEAEGAVPAEGEEAPAAAE